MDIKECLLRLGQNETEAAHIVSQIRERAFRESAHPEKATVDAAWLKMCIRDSINIFTCQA